MHPFKATPIDQLENVANHVTVRSKQPLKLKEGIMIQTYLQKIGEADLGLDLELVWKNTINYSFNRIMFVQFVERRIKPVEICV